MEKTTIESSEIKIGDLVEPYRHYEFDETKTAILKPGPSSEVAGTKWRFLGFGIYKDKDKYELDSSIIEGLKQTERLLKQHVDFELDFDGLIELLELDKELDENPVVELELVEGTFQHLVAFQESRLRQDDSQAREMLPRDRVEIVESPGYIRRISNALGYRRSFPHTSPHQQFFDEWRKVT